MRGRVETGRAASVRGTAMAGMLLVAAGGVQADTLRVPGEYATIQQAIDASVNGDKIVVSDGVYTGDGNRDVDFGGRAITVKSARGSAGCVIDCQGTQQNPHRGFRFGSGEGPDSVLEGFTILNGTTETGAVDDRFNGGGILVTNASSPTIRNMVIRNTSAACWGGAICCSHFSNPTIESCTLIDNTVGDDGGGVFAWNGSRPVVVNSLIAGNVSDVTGGGITVFDSGATIINCTIVNNTAPYGSGMLDASSNSVVANTIIRGNLDGNQVWGNPQITFSNVEGGFTGSGNINADPMFADAASGDFRILSGSPCSDAGNSSAVPSNLLSDLSGMARFMDDSQRQDSGIGPYPIVDIGAYENQGGPPCNGAERIASSTCRLRGDSHSLRVKLKGGTPQDAFVVLLSSGETAYGSLNQRGAGKARFRSLSGDERSVEAVWGCGARDTAAYSCP